MRLIDADALREKSWDADTRIGYVQVVDVGDIDDAPTIDPYKHGKWVEKPYLFGSSNFCSVCGDNFGMPHGKYKYCPTCGAEMDL